jgi:phosphotransferase system HPr-like phosphotransfer protein
MNKIKVILDTQRDISEFVHLATSIDEEIYLEDGTGLKVNAKSLMGVMYGTSEFKDLYVISDNDTIATKFLKFIV